MSLIAITVNLILNWTPQRLLWKIKMTTNEFKKRKEKKCTERGDKWFNNIVYQPLNPHLKTLNNNFIKPCTPLPKMLNDFCSSLSRIWTHEFCNSLYYIKFCNYHVLQKSWPASLTVTSLLVNSPIKIKGSNMAFYYNFDYYGALAVQSIVDCGCFFLNSISNFSVESSFDIVLILYRVN